MMLAKASARGWGVMMMAALVSGLFAFAAPLPAKASSAYWYCTIVIGGGGQSETHTVHITEGSPAYIPSVRASEFVRSTDGPCVFTIFNQANFGGAYVTLGTHLDDRIRAGVDGVENRDSGGGDTWRIRSIRIEARPDQSCSMYIGGNGVRMLYPAGNFEVVPAMNRVGWFLGQSPVARDNNPSNDGIGCTAMLYNSTGFGGSFDILFPFTDDGSAHDPGFRARSLKIWWHVP